ncbi:MAG: CopD family protein [Ilumatobacter sp.]|uniref:copper resistance D family protein n=1 Tax=Ilumatobacter sp. TaxID=1967498 RepID=UPI00262A012A|nr:CopD family protein [Ilumatobacter sp.]MDJ0769303.1 CopD family protein [Ilumatobacter sp.]
MRFVPASTPLDDFLADAGSATDTGELLQRIGLFGSLGGATLAAGLLVLLAVVHRGSHAEIRLLLRVVAMAGLFMVIGAAVEVAGVADINGQAWPDALTSSAGSAAMMRLLGGLLVVLGLFDDVAPIGRPSSGTDAENEAENEAESSVRWVPSAASAFGMTGAIAALLSFGFDGHTVTEGPRALHALTNVVHVASGSVWFGGIVGLAVLALRRRADGSAAPLIVRFSSVATGALILVAVAGGLMTLMIVDGLGELTDTDWGRRLLLKTGAIGIAVAIGAYNHFVVVPALDRHPDGSTAMVARSRATLMVEATVLVLVVVLTVLLAGASTN